MVLSSINADLRDIAIKMHYVFAAIDPPYSLMGTLNFIALLPAIYAFALLPAPTASDYFSEPTIYVPMITLSAQTIIFVASLYYIDFVRHWLRYEHVFLTTSVLNCFVQLEKHSTW